MVRVVISHNINKLKDYLCPLSLVAWIFVGSIITFQKEAFLFNNEMLYVLIEAYICALCQYIDLMHEYIKFVNRLCNFIEV